MKPVLEITSTSLNDLSGTVQSILNYAGNTKLFLIYAPMGAGKTTLIKEFCKQLGSTDHFSSPTYSIINEYTSPKGKIFHFDLYRLKNEEELMDLGIEDYLSGKDYCFFEWPELLENMIDVTYLKIEIKVNDNIRYLRVFQF